MKKVLPLTTFLLAGLTLMLISCKKLDLAIDVPSCVKTQIRKIKEEKVRNPPAQVWKWEVDQQTYFYITSDCCDQFNYLYDGKCREVCAPDGGFTGKGDGDCPDFKGQIEKTLIWEDDRD